MLHSQANPPVGKDLPPDLAGLIPSDAVVLPDPPEKRASSQGPNENLISVSNKPTATVGMVLLESQLLAYFLFQYVIILICLSFHGHIEALFR